jgi:hypothetical protein
MVEERASQWRKCIVRVSPRLAYKFFTASFCPRDVCLPVKNETRPRTAEGYCLQKAGMYNVLPINPLPFNTLPRGKYIENQLYE